MTKENNPKVIMVSGNPKMLRIGFTIRFSTPKTMAKTIADPKSFSLTPGKIFVNRNATTAVISKRIIRFIINFLC